MLRLLGSRTKKSKSSWVAGDRPRRSRRLRGEFLERRDLLSGTPPTVVDVLVASTQWDQDFFDYLETSGLGEGGYSIPTGSSTQTRTLSWTGIDQIKIHFSEDVHVDAADLSLSGVNVTAYAFSDFSYSIDWIPQTQTYSYVAAWTLSSPIIRDRLRIDLDADGLDPVRDQDGNVLDGEWINSSSTVSGDGTAGGDFEFNFNVLPGDLDGSAAVMYNDLAYIYQSLGKSTGDAGYNVAHDIDGNGTIDTNDRNAVAARLFTSLPLGYAAGTWNDAPTSLGHDPIVLTDDAVDHVFSLTDWFDDAESGSSGLTYSIVSNSASELFDSATINSTTNSLVLNSALSASGRAEITVRATDSGGLFVDSTVIVDVNYENRMPELDVVPNYVGGNTWVISGTVSDPDDDLTGLIVEFSGEIQMRASVDEDGNFEFAVILEPDAWGEVEAVTHDSHGVASNVVYFMVGIT